MTARPSSEKNTMTEIRVNKPEAARRQIEVAIRLLFSNDDPVAIHTLTAAGFRILRDIAHGKGIGRIQRWLDENIKPGMAGEYWAAINRPANFLKHADADPDEVLDGVKEEVNDGMLLMACMYYQDIGYELTPTMTGFMRWASAMYPHLIREDLPVKAIFQDRNLDWLRAADRERQLEMGRIAVEHAIANPDKP